MYLNHQAHNLKVAGSNPAPATKQKARYHNMIAGFFLSEGRPALSLTEAPRKHPKVISGVA